MSQPHFARPSLFVVLAALAGGAQAQQWYDLSATFTDFTTWTLQGSASAQNTVPGNGFQYSLLQLTQVGSGGQAGSGFAPQALALNFNQPIHFDFHFFIPANDDGVRGDGLTFVLAGAAGLGNGGSGLGYEGIGNSVAVAVDTFHFDGEPVSPSVQILRDGSVSPLAYTETGWGDTIRGTTYQSRVTIDWTPSGLGDFTGTLVGTLSNIDLGSFSVQAQLDLSNLAAAPVYYGFTAGNGLATDGHFVTSAIPVPEPATLPLLLAGLGIFGLRLSRQRAATHRL